MIIFRLLVFFIFVFFIVGCNKAEKHYLPPKIQENLHSILVLPFQICSENENNIFFCPVKNIFTGKIEPYATKEMDKLLRKKLEKFSSYYHFVFLSQSEFEKLMAEIMKKDSNPKEIIKNFCQKTNTQALLYGRIYRFKQREGSSFAIKEPASVAFVLVLYDGASAQILWTGYFDETQKPLSENILNLRIYKKLKWLTAEELAENGLDFVLKTFPLK